MFLCGTHSFSIVARHGISPGQSLVIPRRHVATIEELMPDELADLMQRVSDTVSALRVANVAQDFNVAINLGVLAGQSVEHVHVHIIPRHSLDTVEPKRWLSEDLFDKLQERSDGELEATCQEIRKALKAPSMGEDEIDFHPSIPEAESREAYISFKNTARYSEGYVNDEMRISIGTGSIIRSGTVLYRDVKIGERFECGHNALIRENSSVGSDVCLYTGSQVQKGVTIGDRCIVSGWVGNSSIVGNDVKMFGELVHKYKSSGRGALEPAPEILDGAFVGWNAIVVGGVKIGRGSVVGAGSVVTSDVPDGCLVVGNPAKTK
jgi:diadenosine tetraphosphate (Ap4A) HIT family hydrolase/acetyltransferase-like isoleucine patch superfamily enzyme